MISELVLRHSTSLTDNSFTSSDFHLSVVMLFLIQYNYYSNQENKCDIPKNRGDALGHICTAA